MSAARYSSDNFGRQDADGPTAWCDMARRDDQHVLIWRQAREQDAQQRRDP